MTRPALLALVCTSLGLLSGPSAQSPDDPGLEKALSVVTAATQDPAVESVLAELSWRHTGLSERELRQVAITVVAESTRFRIDPSLVLAVVQVESGGYNFAESEVGALGLMQLMPSTGEQLAHRLGLAWWGPETLFDPVVNVKLGIAYLKELSDRFGSWSAALAAYNWGPGHIGRRIRRGVSLPSSYVRQVMRIYAVADPARSS